MHLVFFTKKDSVRQSFQKIFAPILKKEFHNDEHKLKTFLKNLKVPTQVIIDQQSFSGSLPHFVSQVRFHHIIIYNDNYHFEDCLKMVRQGLLLMNLEQLMCPDWWWNRTLMQTTRKKTSQLTQPSLVLIPPTSVVNLYHLIYENIDSLFFEGKNARMLYLSSQDSLADNSASLQRFAQDIGPREQPVVYCSGAGLWPPHQRRQFLQQAAQSLPQSCVFIETDGTQTLTEQALDQMVALQYPGIYRLNHRKVEKKIYQQPGLLQQHNWQTHAHDLLELEYIRYTWQPERQDRRSLLP